MKYEDVQTWDDFVEYAKSTSPEAKAEMEKLDKLVDAICFVMDGLKDMEMGIEIYNLDEVEEVEEETAEAIAVTA
ncbi:MAG: hypothetical protein IJR98_03995 [Synergistaceae bacterium]|nr:hypothetical protein [Synergistaceae bacterium]